MAERKNIGLPGGPNEFLQDITQYISVDGYKRHSDDVTNPVNIIESGSITMEDVDFPIMGTDNLGNSQMMFPENEYQFSGDMVMEIPMAQIGLPEHLQGIDLTQINDENSSKINSEAYRNRLKTYSKKMGKEEWKQLDGRRAWDDVYDGLLRFSLDLRRNGYGFFYICHLVNAKIPLGDDRYTIRPELTITDNFYKRLFPMFELVAAFESDWVMESKQVQMKGIGGKPGPMKTETTKVQKYFMTVNDEALAGITKCRVKLPDQIELPQESAWTSFEGQYISAQKS